LILYIKNKEKYDFQKNYYNYVYSTMNIIEFYYNEENENLYIEFSTDNDKDSFYRTLEVSFHDIEYYSPTIIDESDMKDLDNDFILDFLNSYFMDNDLPNQETL